MADEDERVTRLSERFATIRLALEELTDDDTAFAAATVAYLEVVDFIALQGFNDLVKRAGTTPPELHKSLVLEMQEAVRMGLNFYHKQLCEYLKVDQVAAVKRSASFKEIVDDICKQRG